MKKRLPSTMADNGPPPDTAAALYDGTVMHHRHKPVGHRFTYGVYTLLIDIDRLEEANTISPLLGIEASALLTFRTSDHLRDGQSSLRAQADGWYQEVRAGASPPARWLLLCYPRMFGWVFNPISVWFAFDEAGKPLMVVYDVRNTFGGRHAYLAPVEAGEVSDAGIRQKSGKRLHVSPFLGPDMTYHFRVLPPGGAVKLRIHETADGESLFEAVFAGAVKRITTANILRYLVTVPFLPFKIYAAIHWEALRLWWKGVQFLGAGDRHRDDHATIGPSFSPTANGPQPSNSARPGARDAA